jgi:hypothetical protein
MHDETARIIRESLHLALVSGKISEDQFNAAHSTLKGACPATRNAPALSSTATRPSLRHPGDVIMDDVEILAEALNEVYGAYPWDDGADKPVARLRALEVLARVAAIRSRNGAPE